MAKPQTPDTEIQAYESRLTLSDMAGRFAVLSGHNDGAPEFRSDFLSIAHAITDPDWHKPPRPHGIADLPPFRTYAIPRRLPFGPLRRMARLIGANAVRYLFAVGSDQGADFYRLELRQRLEKEFRRSNHYKTHDQEATLIRFGNAVLGLEREGLRTRSEALEAAAQQLGIAASDRSHERYFHRFKMHCERLGYVPSSLNSIDRPPKFALADLVRRTSDKPQK